MAAAGGAGAGPAGGGIWARKDEFLTLKKQKQQFILFSDVEVGKEYYIQFGYNADPNFSFKSSLATCTQYLGGPNNEKQFVGDIVDGDGNIVRLGVIFTVADNSTACIYTWPPPNEGTGGSREQCPYPVWPGGTGSTASRKKSKKLKRKNRKSRKNRR